MYRLLIAEDDSRLREALGDYFKKKEYDVELAPDGNIAMKIFDAKTFDLAILDVMLPKADGFQVCETIRAHSDIPVIFLTARTAEEDQLRGFQAKADDYVTKPFSLKILSARVESLLARYNGISKDSKLTAPGLSVDMDSRTVEVDGVEVKMPPRVYELLVFMMMNKGRILTREQILDCVWGEEAFIYDRAVDSSIRKLRYMLGIRSGYIHTIIKVGYRFEDSDY